MSEEGISRVLFCIAVTFIHLDEQLPTRSHIMWSGLPWCMRRATYIFFGLAPVGVYLATTVTSDAGALLPHPFSLTKNKSFPPHQCHAKWFALMQMKPQYGAVYFLLHFPPSYLDWALPSDLLYGARTFLPAIHTARMSPFLWLWYSNRYQSRSNTKCLTWGTDMCSCCWGNLSNYPKGKFTQTASTKRIS